MSMRLTIGTKLVALVTLLLLGVETILVGLSAQLFVEDNAALIQQMNAEKVATLAAQIRTYLEFYQGQLNLVGEMWVAERGRRGNEGSLARRFFETQSDLKLLRFYESTELKAEF